MQTTQQKGMILALIAYAFWSVFPLYFKRLESYDSMEIIVHRAFWTFLFLSLFLLIKRHWHFIATLKANPKWLGLTFVSGFLIACNWLTYVWAVNHDKIIDASLGYFLSPLFGIALSFFVLKERLRALQWLAVVLASLAMLLQIAILGSFPIVALTLAVTFSLYGLLHKKNPLDAVSALFIETALMLPFFLGWLWTHDVATKQLATWQSSDIFWLILSGPITLIPLLAYNRATKLLNFNTLSFMQYISPTAVFLIGVFYYGEAFDLQRLFIFALIWLGLALYTLDLLKHRKTA